MNMLTSKEIAEIWGISDRSVRNYCSQNRVEGATLIGKIWYIPENTKKPKRLNASAKSDTLLQIIRKEKQSHVKGGIYHRIQIELTYNSNHIEGSRLTHDQTRYIYETNTIGIDGQAVNVDDIIETTNHFRCIDLIIDKADYEITEKLIKDLHLILKTGTQDSKKSWFAVGGYKKLSNEVASRETTAPENVKSEIVSLLESYNQKENITFEDLIDFHVKFERIHPFQDGNGRVGRLILFKECLKYSIVPFIIDDELKYFYYRGLNEWSQERGYLIDTCLTAQDKFKQYLDYFKINY